MRALGTGQRPTVLTGVAQIKLANQVSVPKVAASTAGNDSLIAAPSAQVFALNGKAYIAHNRCGFAGKAVQGLT
jgi:hypothetical protein